MEYVKPSGWPGDEHRVGTIGTAATSPAEAVRWLCETSLSRRSSGVHVHLVNAYSVALADKESNYRVTLENGAVNFPDGKPLTWVSKLRRDVPTLRQVRGPAFFLETFDAGRQYGIRHFLLGSTEEVVDLVEARAKAKYPGVLIVGRHCPPFRPASPTELKMRDQLISNSQADIVWVGLGTPKQDYEARRLAQSLGITAVAVGAAFDFAAGSASEAPAWVRTIGFEWLWRLGSEPRRLWRRYLFGNARFLKAALCSGHCRW